MEIQTDSARHIAVKLHPRGGAAFDLQMNTPARGVAAGPLARVYGNEYRQRANNPARLSLAETLRAAAEQWANADQGAA